jgi:hypothetical protein
MNYNIPVLFIFFNRSEIAKESFKQIRRIKPSKLYLASDGARKEKKYENSKVKKVRDEILNMIDWECEVKVLFQEKNLGCGQGVYTAINWLFKEEEVGIILEDDCIAQKSFFPYVETLLEKYKFDTRIGMISGMNVLKESESKNSYIFSRYKSCWGWATWRRSWENMDLNMKWRGTLEAENILKNMGYKGRDVKYWKYRLKLIDAKDVSAWDWQWYFSLAAQNQLSIFPTKSLISNIGFTEESTHTASKPKNSYSTTEELDFPMRHPEYIIPSYEFDKAYYKENENFIRKIIRYFPIWMKNKIKKILRGWKWEK